VLLAAALLVAGTRSTVNGYEPSIYANIPYSAWVLMSLAFGISIYIMIRFARNQKSLIFLLSLLLLFLVSVFELSIPAIKYNVMYGVEDNWYHAGYCQDILKTGHVDLTLNYYPLFHILVVTLSQVSSISVLELLAVIMPILYSLKTPLIYLLARNVLKDDLAVVIITGFSAVNDYLGGGTIATPWQFSLILLLLILILVLSSTNWLSRSLMLVILIFGVVIAHLLTALIIVLGLAAFGLVQIPLQRRLKNKDLRLKLSFLLPFLLVLFISLAWAFYGALKYTGYLKTFFETIASSLEATPGLLGPHVTLTSFSLFLRFWSAKIILSVFAIFGIAVTVANTFIRKIEQNWLLTILVGWLLVCGIGLLIVEHTVTGALFEPTRFVVYMFLVIPVFSGFGLSKIANIHKGKRIFWILIVIVVLIAAFVSGFYTVYSGPYIQTVNIQTTNYEIKGVEWLISHMKRPMEVWTGNKIGAIAAGLYGLNETQSSFVRDVEREFLLNYLGYTNDSSLSYGEQLYLRQLGYNPKPVFVVIDEFMMFYVTSEFHSSMSDLDKLNSKVTDDQVYCNGEYWVYSVNATISK
jgi:hypothetical protein